MDNEQWSVRQALHVVLDKVDYTAGACSPATLVGAALEASIIDKARAALGLSQEPRTVLAKLREKEDASLISSLRDDEARLDWLDANWRDGVHVEVCAENEGITHHGLHPTATVFFGNQKAKGKDVRSAIDTARPNGGSARAARDDEERRTDEEIKFIYRPTPTPDELKKNVALETGMSQRDYLAAHAPINLADAIRTCGYCDDEAKLNDDTIRRVVLAVLAMMRYEYADAMLEARNAR